MTTQRLLKARRPIVSVIILNYNGTKDTIVCLKSLTKTKFKDFEIVLVDNGSDNGNAENLTKQFKNRKIRIYSLKRNLGFTGGNNWALKKTKGKYVVLLNNDTQVTPNWLGPMVDLLESDKKIAVVQPKIKMSEKRDYFDYAGAAGGFVDDYGFPFTRGRIFNTQEKDVGQYDGVWPIFWASGAACVIRKSVVKNVGGLFYNSLFNYMEEIDFCWRVWRAGFKVLFTSDATIYHKVAGTSGKNIIQKRFWEHRNNLFVLIRNLDRKKLLKILAVRIVLEMVAYSYYIVSRQNKYLKSLFMAHVDFVKKCFFIRLARNRKLLNNRPPIYPGSIIFDHYIKKRKTFKSLEWSPKANISYLIYSPEKNTGNTVVFNQANRLKEKGYGVQIYSLLGQNQNWFDLKVRLKNVIFSLFDNKKDILIATFWPTAYLLPFIYAKDKYFFSQDWGPSMHDFVLFKKLAYYSYKLPVKKIVHSNFLKKMVKKVDSKNKIYQIRYCVLDPIFSVEKKMARKTNQTRLKILSVISWYATTKGPDLLEKAVGSLTALHPSYHFTLVSREKRPYSSVFDRFVSDPSKKKMRQLYHESNILLATSRTEGMPIPGLEAMASGCVLVTTNNGGVMEYAKNNVNSIVLKDLEDLWKKDTIDRLFRSPNKVERLVAGGYQTVKSYYDTFLTEDLEKLFNGKLHV